MLRLKLNFPCFECIFFLLCILAVLLKLFFSVFRSRNQKKSPADEERREYIQGGIRVDFGGKGMKKIHRKGSNNSNFKFLSPLQASIFFLRFLIHSRKRKGRQAHPPLLLATYELERRWRRNKNSSVLLCVLVLSVYPRLELFEKSTLFC